MKQMFRKGLIMIMAMVMMIGTFTLSTLAADGVKEEDGVKVSISTDKEKYKNGDIPKITVNVENGSDFDIEDLDVKYVIPDELSRADGKQIKMKELAAGKSDSVSTDFKINVDIPATIGDYVPFIIIGVVVVAAIIIILIILSKKKKSKSTIAAMMALMIGLSSLANINTASATTNNATDTAAEVKNSDFKRVSVHDPSIVKDGDNYYVFGSHMAWAKSTDLKSWTPFKNNINMDFRKIFKEGIEWSSKTDSSYDPSGNMWAPDVIYNKDMKKYCMYMSVNGVDWHSSIAMATADSIEGPYTYAGTVTWSGMDTEERAKMTDFYKVLGEGADIRRYRTDPMSGTSAKINAIDPNVFYDADGKLWMVYGSWSAGIYMLELDKDTGLRDYDVTYDLAANESDPYLGTKVAGGCYVSGEAPYIIKMGDYYFMFLSYGGLEAAKGYQMRIFRSENPDGPYVDQNGVSAKFKSWSENFSGNVGYKIFGSYRMTGISQVQVAQGHNSAFIDEDGKAFVVYHTRYYGGGEGHQVRVHQMTLSETGWPVAAPYEYSGETIPETGYDKSEVVGEYEFVKHTTDQWYKVVNSKPVGIVGSEKDTKSISVSKEVQLGEETVKLGVKINYSKKGGIRISLNDDGTVTGSYDGTWSVKEGTNELTLKVDNVEYSGVFVQQADETAKRTQRMTFTAIGDNVAIWGIKVQ